MTEFAKMYGGSLFELAAEEGADGAILTQLEECLGLLGANPDYLKLLSTPSLPKKSAAACWMKLCGGRCTSTC